MSMNYLRYNEIRSRLMQLYKEINFTVYQVYIAPEKLMTLDQLRDRFTYTSHSPGGSATDENYYSEKSLRNYRIPQLIDIMPNLQSYKDFNFKRPQKTIVTIYENIQEWIGLWCDIIRQLPDFKHPPIKELRLLENFAYLLYSEYAKIKPYAVREANSKAAMEATTVNDKGLATLGALFGLNSALTGGFKDPSVSWYSHLDALNPNESHYGDLYDPGSIVKISNSFSTMAQDSLGMMEQTNTNPNWIFNAG